ncbi:hypothetical protein LSAT2_011963 [Lamellibrachia satsuma]|nr:hypothetical protein LSAT2_011963 [Lamellibrachia satsuma]
MFTGSPEAPRCSGSSDDDSDFVNVTRLPQGLIMCLHRARRKKPRSETCVRPVIVKQPTIEGQWSRYAFRYLGRIAMDKNSGELLNSWCSSVRPGGVGIYAAHPSRETSVLRR